MPRCLSTHVPQAIMLDSDSAPADEGAGLDALPSGLPALAHRRLSLRMKYEVVYLISVQTSACPPQSLRPILWVLGLGRILQPASSEFGSRTRPLNWHRCCTGRVCTSVPWWPAPVGGAKGGGIPWCMWESSRGVASMPCGGGRPLSPCLTASHGNCVNAAPTAASDCDGAVKPSRHSRH